jgi:hypothetical protein
MNQIEIPSDARNRNPNSCTNRHIECHDIAPVFAGGSICALFRLAMFRFFIWGNPTHADDLESRADRDPCGTFTIGAMRLAHLNPDVEWY